MNSIKEHSNFSFNSLGELEERIKILNLDISFNKDIQILLTPIKINNLILRNRMIIQPMEGCDGNVDGSPEELTYRRYKRFASGGASMIWLEACAVVPEGRANPRQLWITKSNLSKFKKLVDETQKAAQVYDKHNKTYLILQLTHSGRYSKPYGNPRPIIAHHSKILDPVMNLPENYPLIKDDELQILEDKYLEAALLAEEAGFDGIDLKDCHRYLLSELLASFTRVDSIYGGSFENRTRFIRNVANKIKKECKSIFITTRINAYDSMEYPYGFGTDKNDYLKPDLTELNEIIRFYKSIDSPLINITIGNPYFNPHIGRPFDLPTIGGKLPSENPLYGVSRFFNIVREIQFKNPEFPIIGGGYTWLRQFFPYAAAENLTKKWVSIVGLGRMGFAYPNFVKELYQSGKLDPLKVCVSCSACTQIMRDGGKAGCVPRDGEVYGEIYRTGRMNNPEEIIKMAEECRNCINPTCQELCPAKVNISGFVRKISEGDFEGAYQIIVQSNPFPEICGNVCPSEELCEKGCINRFYNESVKIKHLQRFVSEKARQNNYKPDMQSKEILPKNKKVAIIGAGPSGLSCARSLILEGFEVTLFDKNNYLGGVPLDLIPTDRISNQTLISEIEFQTLQNKFLKFRGNKSLSKEFNLDSIFSEGFDSIFIATGLMGSIKLRAKNIPKSGVEDAFSFLKRMKKGTNTSIPPEVAIIGGGNTAIDAALTAKRNGARDVYIIYRRSFNEIPAWPKERELAMNTGINFLILTQPVDYVIDNEGCLTGLKLSRTKLLPTVDQSGRRKPVIIPDSEYIMDINLVIEAIGQKIDDELIQNLIGIDLNESGLIKVDSRYQTSRKGVFAGGDIINGGDTVVRAVADGVKAARSIMEFLSE